jgi:uncharacterized protein YdeI (YjbR/CyaY-like superfamily)
MNPKFFKTQAEFRKWLVANHDKEEKLLVGFYKTGSGKPSITWPQSVDEALCFGWIDAVRKGIDEDSYTIRFCRRKKNSIWSAVNIKKIAALKEKGLMYPAGLEAYSHRKEEKTAIYCFENEAKQLSPEFEKKFKANKTAWQFFIVQSPYYQKQMVYRVMTAKQEATRLSRLEKLITASAENKKIER